MLALGGKRGCFILLCVPNKNVRVKGQEKVIAKHIVEKKKVVLGLLKFNRSKATPSGVRPSGMS